MWCLSFLHLELNFNFIVLLICDNKGLSSQSCVRDKVEASQIILNAHLVAHKDNKVGKERIRNMRLSHVECTK